MEEKEIWEEEDIWKTPESLREFPGQRLAEILWLRIRVDKNKDVGGLRGKLKLSSSSSPGDMDFCFPGEISDERRRSSDDSCSNEGRENPAGQDRFVYARLNGPSRAISAIECFQIDLELEKDGPVPKYPEQPYCFCVEWLSYCSIHGPYDEFQDATIRCKHGDVSMGYVVMKDAAEVYVEVFLKSETTSGKIYGRISVWNTFGEVVCFEKGASDGIEVSPKGSIPLSRDVLAVPINKMLTFCVDILDKNSEKSIVQGDVELQVEVDGTAKASIQGKHGEVEVKMTWVAHGRGLVKGSDGQFRFLPFKEFHHYKRN